MLALRGCTAGSGLGKVGTKVRARELPEPETLDAVCRTCPGVAAELHEWSRTGGYRKRLAPERMWPAPGALVDSGSGARGQDAANGGTW